MEPLYVARALAVVNTVVAGGVIALGQRTCDEPRRSRRWLKQAAVGVGAGLVMTASDAVWNRAVRDRTAPVDPDVVPVQDAMTSVRHLGLAAAWAPVWWFGRKVPDRLRAKGNATPNATLAVPLGFVYAATSAPVEWAQARDRVAALTP